MPFQRINARFDGTCFACKKPTIAGNPIDYDRESKRAYHPNCATGIRSREPLGKPELPLDMGGAVAITLARKAGLIP